MAKVTWTSTDRAALDVALLGDEQSRIRANERHGREILARIRARTTAGLDEDQRPFRPYTPAYAAWKATHRRGWTGTVDLTLTGQMLRNLELVYLSARRVVIGFLAPAMAARAAGNEVRHGRRFLGVPRAWLDLWSPTGAPSAVTFRRPWR